MANTISIILTAKDEASSVISGAGGAVEGLASKAAMAAKIGIAALGTGLVVAGTAAIKSAGDFEQSRVAFETMLGSADRARTLLAQISDFAKSTPFDLPEVVQASKQLLAFGFTQDQIIPTMRKLGDIASGVGVPVGQLATVFGQVRTQGKLMGGDILQFTNAGVPIIENLSKVLHVSQGEVRDMVAAGKVGFPEVQASIDSMTGAGSQFGGMMDKQSHTFQGTVSNIKDSFGQILRSAVGVSNTGDIVAGGIFDRIKTAANDMMPKLQEFGNNVGPMMATASKQGSEGVRSLIDSFKSGKSEGEGFNGVMGQVGHAGKLVWDALDKFLGPSLKALAGSFTKDVLPSLKLFVPYLDDAAKIVGGVLVGAIWLLVNGLRIMFETSSFAVKAIFAIKDAVVDAYSGIRRAVMDIGDFGKRVWHDIQNAAVAAWQFIYHGIVHPYMTLISTEFRIIGDVANYIWQWIRAMAELAWRPIYNDIVKPVLDAISNALHNVADAGSNAATNIKENFQEAFDGIKGPASSAWNWIVHVWQGAVQWFHGIFDPIANAGKTASDNIKDAFGNAWYNLKSNAKDTVNWIIHEVNNMIEAVNKVSKKVPGAPKMEKIAYLAQGGIFDKPTQAVIGEDGPEAVVPLSKPNRAREVMQAAGLMQNNAATDNSRHFTFNVTQNINNTMDSSAAIKELEAMVAYA